MLRLDLVTWLMGFERYALAAEVLKQMTFFTAMEHKANVLETACLAKDEGMSSMLGVLFDEVSRYMHAPLVSIRRVLFASMCSICHQAEVGRGLTEV